MLTDNIPHQFVNLVVIHIGKMEKEYGKFTYNQFCGLVKRLPEIRSDMREIAKLARSRRDKINLILGPDKQSWGHLYEMPYLEQMALLMVLVGLHEPLHEAALSDDPQQRVLEWLDPDGVLQKWFDQNEDKINMKYLVWLTVIFQRNIYSIMLYHQPMGALVESARNGDDEAFFKAVRVDRTVLNCSTFADRLARAELDDEKDFFLHLRSAIKGPSKKHMSAIQDLRYAIVLLREAGFDKYSDAQLEKLFINTRLYPNSPSAHWALRKHIREARNFSTT